MNKRPAGERVTNDQGSIAREMERRRGRGPGCRIDGCPVTGLHDHPTGYKPAPPAPPAGETLALCPLCRELPKDVVDSWGMDRWMCANGQCELFEVWFRESEWRRLASPRVPETVVEILRECAVLLMRYHDGPTCSGPHVCGSCLTREEIRAALGKAGKTS